MNIIIVNDYASVQGGAAQVAVASAKGLADSGHNITFIYALGKADPLLNHPNIQLVNFEQYDLLSNPSRINAMIVGIWNLSVAKQMDVVLNSFDKEDTIVHIHSWVKALSVSIVSVILKRKFLIVLTLHDYFTVCPNGGFYNYQRKSICHLEPMSLDCLASNCDSRSYSQKLWRYLRQTFYIKAGMPSQIKHFISVSKFSENILKPYLSKNAKFWDVPNPIDIQCHGKSNPEDSSVFSFIGRLSAEKGATLFADASNRLCVSARFVGDGNLETILKNVKINADFIGWSNRVDVIRYIKDSRAIVFPSQLYETQGLIVTEAAALGVPSIVSNSCAASENIVDNKTGLLFESGNVESLMKKIQLLSEKPDLAKKLGQNAYEQYWKNSDNIGKHLNCLTTCYQEVLNDFKTL